MKVLFLNTIIKDGSTGSILYRLRNEFRRRGHETLVLYGRGDHKEDGLVRVTSRPELLFNAAFARLFGTQGSLSFFSAAKIKREIKRFSPDAVVLGNLHGYYLNEKSLFSFLKRHRIPTFYFLFDEYAFLGKCAYAGNCENYKTGCGHCPNLRAYPKTYWDRSRSVFRQKQKNYADFENLYFLSTPYNCDRAKSSPLVAGMEGRILPLGWGIDVKGVYRPTDPSEWIKKIGIDPERPVILALGGLTDGRKGIADVFFPMAEACKNPSLQFLHVGNDDPSVPVPKNCISLPFVKDQKDLSAIFTLADLFVITSREDTYPTVCLISQACGTPIAGFRASGVPSTGNPETSFFADADKAEDLSAYVYNTSKKAPALSAACREYALSHFDAEEKAGELEALIKKAVKKQL